MHLVRHAQVLVRDRLTQKTSVAPVIKRLVISIISMAVALVLTLGSGEDLTAIEGEADSVS